LKLLAQAPPTDGLQLQKTLAAISAHSPDAPRLAASMHRRYVLARAVGAVPELRDEAELALATDADPTRALTLAEENFASQRDFEDVDILLRAARAARRPDVVSRTTAWLRRSGIDAQSGATR
jgi:hypothetical protein